MNRDVPAPSSVRVLPGATIVSLLPHGGWSLTAARQWLSENLDEGKRCPCCNQLAKRYRRKLYSTQARTLIYAHHTFGREYFHLSLLDGKQPGVRQADFPKLAFWSLIERHPSKAQWRITAWGQRFVQGQAKCQETVLLYDGEYQGFEGPHITIDVVLGSHFDYEELMRSC